MLALLIPLRPIGFHRGFSVASPRTYRELIREGERNIYRKVKKNFHKTVSPASVDNLVHKSLRPSISCHFLG